MRFEKSMCSHCSADSSPGKRSPVKAPVMNSTAIVRSSVARAGAKTCSGSRMLNVSEAANVTFSASSHGLTLIRPLRF